MHDQAPKIKGIYCIVLYIGLVTYAMMASGISDSMAWPAQAAKWLSLPLLILFFYLNTSIDSKFEKHVFYGIILFALSSLMTIAIPVLGHYTLYLILAIWIIGYFNYAKALISITSISSSLLYQRKWLAGLILIFGLVGLYFILTQVSIGASLWVPMMCLGLANIILLMAAINIYQQVSVTSMMLFMSAVIVMQLYNCLTGLNISNNISIFESNFAFTFHLGQMIFIFAAVRASIHFKNDDRASISNVLKKVV